MKKILEKQLKQTEKTEARIIAASEKKQSSGLVKKIDEKIPAGLKEKLEWAFYQGFRFVFDKGTAVIEKTCAAEKRKLEYDVHDYGFEKQQNKKALRSVTREADKSTAANMGIAAAEGSILGLLGIGLPDIPIFIGVLLKGIYETALSYGFKYDTSQERYYILLLIEAAFTDGKLKREYDTKLECVALGLEQGDNSENSLDAQMKETASVMATQMLCLKFIQGIPIVGIIGGAANVVYLNKVMKYARIKYKKRYLCKKQRLREE